MIHISNINIEFDATLIQNGELHICPGELTLIKGKSGSGKTSLLYIVGLLRSLKDVHYQFGNELIRDNDREKALYRKELIAYVFQEKMLLEHLSIYENLCFYSHMVARDLSRAEAKTLLSMVRLSKGLDDGITTLSGGERQRLAIACALSKRPALLILDEPTSALDKTNTEVIMNILKDLARQDYMILLASHDSYVASECDVIYEIKDTKLIRNQAVKEDENRRYIHRFKRLKLSFYVDYYLRYFKHHWLSTIAMLLIIGLAVGSFISLNRANTEIAVRQINQLDNLSNREILVTSYHEQDDEVRYSNSLPVFDQVMLFRIQASNNLKDIHPFFEGFIDEVQVNGIVSEGIYANVQPYPSARQYQYHCEWKDSDNGVYVMPMLASMMDLKSGDLLSIHFELPNGEYITLHDLAVAGVLEGNVPNDYTGSNDIIYVPYELLPEIKEAKAYLAYATHYNTIQYLLSDIEMVSVQLGTYTRFVDTTNLKDAENMIRFMGPMMNGLIFIISLIMVFLFYSRYIANRKIEICLLKANGLSKKELLLMILNELLVQTLIATLFSMVFTIIFNYLATLSFTIEIQHHYILSLLQSLCIALGYMAIPGTITLFLYARYDPAVVLRSDV